MSHPLKGPLERRNSGRWPCPQIRPWHANISALANIAELGDCISHGGVRDSWGVAKFRCPGDFELAITVNADVGDYNWVSIGFVPACADIRLIASAAMDLDHGPWYWGDLLSPGTSPMTMCIGRHGKRIRDSASGLHNRLRKASTLKLRRECGVTTVTVMGPQQTRELDDTSFQRMNYWGVPCIILGVGASVTISYINEVSAGSAHVSAQASQAPAQEMLPPIGAYRMEEYVANALTPSSVPKNHDSESDDAVAFARHRTEVVASDSLRRESDLDLDSGGCLFDFNELEVSLPIRDTARSRPADSLVQPTASADEECMHGSANTMPCLCSGALAEVDVEKKVEPHPCETRIVKESSEHSEPNHNIDSSANNTACLHTSLPRQLPCTQVEGSAAEEESKYMQRDWLSEADATRIATQACQFDDPELNLDIAEAKAGLPEPEMTRNIIDILAGNVETTHQAICWTSGGSLESSDADSDSCSVISCESAAKAVGDNSVTAATDVDSLLQDPVGEDWFTLPCDLDYDDLVRCLASDNESMSDESEESVHMQQHIADYGDDFLQDDDTNAQKVFEEEVSESTSKALERAFASSGQNCVALVAEKVEKKGLEVFSGMESTRIAECSTESSNSWQMLGAEMSDEDESSSLLLESTAWDLSGLDTSAQVVQTAAAISAASDASGEDDLHRPSLGDEACRDGPLVRSDSGDRCDRLDSETHQGPRKRSMMKTWLESQLLTFSNTAIDDNVYAWDDPYDESEICMLNATLREAQPKHSQEEDEKDLKKLQALHITQSNSSSWTRFQLELSGEQRILVTAPHSIHLLRDGDDVHRAEEHTMVIASSISATLFGACLTWSRNVQRHARLLIALAERRGLEDGAFLDKRNRDPNFLLRSEIPENPWFQLMLNAASRWRNQGDETCEMLHIDVHGCRNPPDSPAHIVVGLGPMMTRATEDTIEEAIACVDKFARALRKELSDALAPASDTLVPKAELVHILQVSETDARQYFRGVLTEERFCGAWLQYPTRVTQSQQSLEYAGFSHAVQLEMSRSLRCMLVESPRLLERLAVALRNAWVHCQTCHEETTADL